MGTINLKTAAGGSAILSPANTASDVTIIVPASNGTMALNGTNYTFPDGTVQSTSYNGFKNRLINGGMTVNQRGASSLSSGINTITYTLDRMFVYATGAAVSVSQYTGTNFGTAITSVLSITGAASNTGMNAGQRIEAANTKDLAGTNATVSFWLYQTTGSTQTITTSIYAPTAIDNWANQTTVATFTNSVPASTWTYCTGTVAINANAQYGLGIGIAIGALLAGQSYALGNFQLEKGSTATAFDYRPYGTELQLCQRYYYRLVGTSGYTTLLAGVGVSTTSAGQCANPHPVQMRAAPTVNIANLSAYNGINNTNVTGITAQNSSATNISLNLISSGLTAGQPQLILGQSSAFVEASAEL